MAGLSKEIVVTICIKLLLLWLLWFICFSPYPHKKMTNDSVGRHLLTHSSPMGGMTQ